MCCFIERVHFFFCVFQDSRLFASLDEYRRKGVGRIRRRKKEKKKRNAWWKIRWMKICFRWSIVGILKYWPKDRSKKKEKVMDGLEEKSGAIRKLLWNLGVTFASNSRTINALSGKRIRGGGENRGRRRWRERIERFGGGEEIDLKPVQSSGCRLVNFSAATEMRLTNEALSRND